MSGPVLIVDCDEVERRCLSHVLKRERFQVSEAETGVEGLFRVLDDAPILVLLAEEVPPLESTDLITVFQRLTNAPVIVIGAGGDNDEVTVLEDGADFYARRPLTGGVLLARVRALLRRSKVLTGSAYANGASLSAEPLTPTERRLLVCLAAEGGRPVSAARLARVIWGTDASLGSVKFYVWRLRRKLGPESGLSIDVVRGVGYRLRRTGPASLERLKAI